MTLGLLATHGYRTDGALPPDAIKLPGPANRPTASAPRLLAGATRSTRSSR